MIREDVLRGMEEGVEVELTEEERREIERRVYEDEYGTGALIESQEQLAIYRRCYDGEPPAELLSVEMAEAIGVEPVVPPIVPPQESARPVQGAVRDVLSYRDGMDRACEAADSEHPYRNLGGLLKQARDSRDVDLARAVKDKSEDMDRKWPGLAFWETVQAIAEGNDQISGDDASVVTVFRG